MSAEFVSRILGMIVFTVAGTRLGVDLASAASLSPPLAGFVFALVGVLVGLIVTPWLTVRPYFGLRRALTEMPVELLFMSFLGLLMGTGIALLATYPLSQLAPPLGSWMPTAALMMFWKKGVKVVGMRGRELW